MTEEKPQGCVQSAKGPLMSTSDDPQTKQVNNQNVLKEFKMHVSVGKEAPDFEATAYHDDVFTNIKLSDYRGKWVFLCFYPGDFTFV